MEVHRFENTQKSALSILDDAFVRFAAPDFQLDQVMGSSPPPIRETSFGPRLYINLQARIQNAHMELTILRKDFSGAMERKDAQLTELLIPRIEETRKLLAKFKEEMCDFGSPPDMATPTMNPTPTSEGVDLGNPHDFSGTLELLLPSLLTVDSRSPHDIELQTPVVQAHNVNPSSESHQMPYSFNIAQTFQQELNFDIVPNHPENNSPDEGRLTGVLRWMKRWFRTLRGRR